MYPNFLGEEQPFPRILTHIFLFCHIQRNFHPGRDAPVLNDSVLQQEMAAAVLILVFPDIKGILAQHIVGAEIAGGIFAMQNFIAFFPL